MKMAAIGSPSLAWADRPGAQLQSQRSNRRAGGTGNRPADFAFLKLVSLPGAVDLLARYEAMTPESRRLLVDLLQSIELAPA